MKELLLIKIGGGVITDKKVRYGLKEDILTRLVQEIAAGYKELHDTDLIVGNGAGSFAHFSAHEYRTAEGFVDERSQIGLGWVRYDAVKLNQIVFEELLKVGVPAYSFSPSSMIRVENGKTVELHLASLRDSLEKGMVPLVYGDAMIDKSKGSVIYSTERVFDELANSLASGYDSVRVIHVSSEEGVLVDGIVYPEITKKNLDSIKPALSGSKGTDVTGGMLHKVEECLELTKLGVASQIISGLIEGRVRDAILGSKVIGTTIC